jgi:ADP-ribose pyrophosphatase YjhB (NUDIX family)
MGVVERDGMLLLVRRAGEPWRGCWDVPGGFCDPGEHPVHTAEREVLEETGWRARAVALIGMWVDSYGSPDPDGLQEMTLNIAYLARPLDDQPAQSPDHETAAADWFAIDDLPTALAFPGHIPAILQTAQIALAGPLPPLLDRPR